MTPDDINSGRRRAKYDFWAYSWQPELRNTSYSTTTKYQVRTYPVARTESKTRFSTPPLSTATIDLPPCPHSNLDPGQYRTHRAQLLSDASHIQGLFNTHRRIHVPEVSEHSEQPGAHRIENSIFDVDSHYRSPPLSP